MHDLLTSWRRLFGRVSRDGIAAPGVSAPGVSAPGDLALAALLVAIVVMMIVPLPTLALDFLIALNLAVSLGLLLVALYVTEASRLAVLPSLLLLATLFRLGLTVSTTRLVLLHGDAGRIVEAFGRIVVGGNVVVGGVVFLVLALVQFVVIAKGSERVAEVAARFTLDALPGKQMSIDADLRSGSMTLEGAQERRRALERESQLYGALDGAMKFVKGDAIAGLVVVAINIVGGLAVGVFQRGMPVGAAVAHYTVLTVGDGLVAQLPSLFVSTTAGLVVTRVPGDDDAGNLGGDIAAQVRAHPRALALTGGLLCLLACVPGLPALPFVALGGLALAAGVRGASRSDGGVKVRSPRRASADDAALVLHNAEPVRVALGSSAHAEVARAADALVSAMRARLFAELGLRVPEILFVATEAGYASGYAIEVASAVAASGALPDSTHWIDAPPDELRPFGVEAAVRPAPFRDGPRSWCDGPAAARAASVGYRTGDRAAHVVEHVEATLRTHAAELVGVQEVRDLVDALESTHPALVAEVLPRALSLAQVTDVLRRLAHESVSIRDLRAIFEALAAGAHVERDPVALVELVRAHMRRRLTADVAGGRPGVAVYTLGPAVEDAFRAAARYSAPGASLLVDPTVVELVLARLRELERLPRAASAQRPILVTAQDVRRHVRAAIESELPRLKVYSYQDLTPATALHEVGTVA